MEIIPAIDLIEGKCVRLSQGDYSKKVIYNEDPLEVARQFEDSGLKRLHLVDLEGAKARKMINYPVLEKLASKTDLIIDYGGGIKTSKDVERVFEYGAAMASIGSMAVRYADLFYYWLDKYGGEKILLGADVKGEKISITGWTQTTNVDLFDFLKANVKRGIQKAFVTDISKDGMLEGPSIDLYRKILKQFPKLKELAELKRLGCDGAIIGKALYEGKINLSELQLLSYHKF